MGVSCPRTGGVEPHLATGHAHSPFCACAGFDTGIRLNLQVVIRHALAEALLASKDYITQTAIDPIVRLTGLELADQKRS
jgi:hypothetical protein